MFFECDCSIDVDDCGVPKIHRALYPVARRKHICGECKREILPGEKYEKVSALYDSGWDHFVTCLGCQRLRDRFCSGGFYYGGLPDQMFDCLGFDYTQDPKTLEDEEGG